MTIRYKFQFTRTVRSATSEQFLIHNNDDCDIAVADIHFTEIGTVVVTLTILGDWLATDSAAQELVEAIDCQLLPMANLNDKNLVFNVVRGKLIGVFERNE